MGGAVRAGVESLGLEWISITPGPVERAMVRRPGVHERPYTCQLVLWQGESGELECAIECGLGVTHRLLRMDAEELVDKIVEALGDLTAGRVREHFHERVDGTLETAGWDFGESSVQFRCPAEDRECAVHRRHRGLTALLPAWQIPVAGEPVS